MRKGLAHRPGRVEEGAASFDARRVNRPRHDIPRRQIGVGMIAQQEGMDRLIEDGESAQKLLEAVDEIDPLAVMAVLSEKLPAHAWVTSFRCSDNKVALSLLVKGETDSIVEVLNKEIRPLIVENLRQQLNNDGSDTITVTLQKSTEAPE